MRKIFWFIFWILLGIGIGIISSISDTLICTESNGCIIQSKISIFNLKISEDKFLPEEMSSIRCEKIAQPSRSGKKYYYILKFSKTSNTDYNLGSYRNYQMCKSEMSSIKDFIKGKTSGIRYNSGTGFSNGIGYIFAVLMFIIGIIVLTSKEEVVEDEFDDE